VDGRDESPAKPPDPMMLKSNMPVPCRDGDEKIDSSESSESDRFRLRSILIRFLRRGAETESNASEERAQSRQALIYFLRAGQS